MELIQFPIPVFRSKQQALCCAAYFKAETSEIITCTQAEDGYRIAVLPSPELDLSFFQVALRDWAQGMNAAIMLRKQDDEIARAFEVN